VADLTRAWVRRAVDYIQLYEVLVGDCRTLLTSNNASVAENLPPGVKQ